MHSGELQFIRWMSVAYGISFVAGNLLSAMAAALEGIGTSAKMLRLCIRDLSSSEIQVATGDNGCDLNKKLLQVQASKQQLPDGVSYCKFWAIRLGTPCACGITTARHGSLSGSIKSCRALRRIQAAAGAAGMVVLAERLVAGLLPRALLVRVAALAPWVPVPLLIFTLHESADDDGQALATSLAEALSVSGDVTEAPRHFSTVRVVTLHWGPSSSTASTAHMTLFNGLVWLAENSPSQPQLQVGISAYSCLSNPVQNPCSLYSWHSQPADARSYGLSPAGLSPAGAL